MEEKTERIVGAPDEAKGQKPATRWRNRVIPWTRRCPKCGAEAGYLCRAVSEDDQLSPSGWTVVPPGRGHAFGVAHSERFLPGPEVAR